MIANKIMNFLFWKRTIACAVLCTLLFLAMNPLKAFTYESSQQGEPFSNEIFLDYNVIHQQVREMQEQIDAVVSTAFSTAESPIPYVKNEEIADWYLASRSFTRTSFNNGDRLRDENETLLIKRRAAYLRVIDKVALKENRDLSLLENSTLQLTEEEAIDQAFSFVEFLGVPRKDVFDVDIVKVVGEAGDETGVLERVEAEYLVTILRQKNGIVVADSRIRLAINDKSQVTRVLAQWPELEPQPAEKAAIDSARVALDVFTKLYETYHKNPEVGYIMVPVIAHQIEGNRTMAKPVLRVISSRADRGPVFGFDVDLVE